jgi:putative ABC transport system permease protein
MIKNYLVIAFRNLKKYKIFSVLNIFGLALGISCVVFIYSFIHYELSYEKCYPKADRLYRITHTSVEETTTRYWAPTAPLLLEMLSEQMPEIESYTRMMQARHLSMVFDDSLGTVKKFMEDDGFFADTSIFEMFDLELIYGDPGTALHNPSGMVISASMAERFFGNDNPIGNVLTIENYQTDFVVTGVMKDITGNTHLKMNFLLSWIGFRQFLFENGMEGLYNARTWAGPYNYFLLKEGSRIEDLEKKMDDFIVSYLEDDEKTPEEILAEHRYPIQPIKKIHLHSKLEQEVSPNSDITYVYVFLLVAILILIIAGVNYVNITTAQSMRRIKEIGIRKVVGAFRRQIIWQNLGESFMISIFAGMLSVLIIDLLYPYYNILSGPDYSLKEIFSTQNILIIGGIVVLLGFLSGIYPAFLASGFSIDDNIKGIKKRGSFSNKLRRGLIILQFTISVFLIFSTLVLYRQLRMFNEQDLGFTKENVVAVTFGGEMFNALRNDYAGVKAELKSNPNILEVSRTSNLPGERTSVEDLRYQGMDDMGAPSQRFIRVDEDYLATMEIELLEGENFQRSADTSLQYLINETSVLVSNVDNPIGKTAHNMWGGTGKVVGIVKNHNFASLHEGIEPLVLEYNPGQINGGILVKFQGDKKEAIEYLEEKIKSYAPTDVINFTFITDQWDSLYVTETNAGNTFKAFTLLAIIISCIGLFGLSAFTAELRIKEMGIRKVHGAGLIEIMKLFGLDFFKLILVSTVIALPVGWIIMENWLQSFHYRISISWAFFFYSLVAIIGVSFLTILYQMIKVSRANPIEYIKYE